MITLASCADLFVAAGLLLALGHACLPLLGELDLYYDDNSEDQLVQTLEMVRALNPTIAYFRFQKPNDLDNTYAA
jgi:hypothetical protein